MTRARSVAATVLLLLAAARVSDLTAQNATGAALYGERCSGCHGADGKGLNGPNLTGLWAAGTSDERVFQTVRRGIPGSAMPASSAPDEEIRAIVAHVKSLATPAPAAAGRPAADPASGVTLVLNDGRTIRGDRRNEDAFSIQIVEAGGRLRGFSKTDVREIVRGGSFGAARSSDEAPLAPITYREILEGLKDPAKWVSYHGDYTGQRHSPLTAITPQNVPRLQPEWTFQTGTLTRGRGFESTPLLVDGVLYVTGSNNFAWALDARTGRPFWQYRRELPNDLTYGAQAPVNRGFGILGDRLFMTTLDAHLLAFNRTTGRIVWDVTLEDYKIGYSATVAPLVIDGKVIVGISGGEYPTRCFLDAYDPDTGKRIWRFYTVPTPGEPGSESWPSGTDALARGGGGTWTTGTYDPASNTLYWGTGNPNPDYYGAGRIGDNLYTNSLVAVDAATGRLKWHYQFTPHDTHDWDANQIPVLADLTVDGARRAVVMFANRNGFYYVLDRRDGTLLFGKPFTNTAWAREIGRDGRPIVLNDGKGTCVPDQWGGTNFNPPSFDPALGLFFLVARETCATYTPQEPKIVPGQSSFGGVVRVDREKNGGALRALDAATGEQRWEFPYASPSMAGVLSTASGVVFAGDNEGNFMAFDAKTGRNLWRYATGTPIWGAAPMTYMLDGRQHVVIASGATLLSFVLAVN
jgi:alcohol dehydrogenase (cytochrome c)